MILHFEFLFDSVNASVQAGDLACYIPLSQQGAFDVGSSNQVIVFGEVISGMRIVDFMASTPTGNAMGMSDKGPMPMQNVPIDPIVLLNVTRVSP